MSNFTNKIFATLMALLFGMQTFAANDFNQNRTDFRDESIYFMITTRFYDGDPSNNVCCWDNQQTQIAEKDPCWRGDFQGVIDKLDYIKALGFTAIWITPVVQNASGYDYHGYHASDFSHVDCRYQSGDGSKSGDVMFKDLIEKAHEKGIKIILDLVLNHTGNFGESHFMPEFDRDTNIRNQANISCMEPMSVLGNDYNDIPGASQYQRRLALMKNTDGKNHDIHNYWHHVANAWNWDEPTRWWGQIAGDCVDLNTENDAVAQYLVKCYGEFIKLGVDGFRIDTSGHISRLTFNKVFIPEFAKLGEQYKDKRLNHAPFFMYGEVCARFGGVQYRGQDCLSPFYYTWKSPDDLIASWNSDASWWDDQYVKEGAEPLGNMTLCLQDVAASPKSDNAFMINGQYHEPDYSQSSGFNVIDFPLHYNFTSAGSAYGLAKSGDNCYNDATYNVVYVDSHDYGPQPNDGVRFSGSDDQWAENLSLMFTFRGIPCIYYGSEIGFKRGVKIDNGPNGPLSNTGRAYFGGYITGDVEADDFGEYKASGNVAATLNHDLAQHLIRLNKIRQAVPALRKGQWTSDGCQADGGIAFKRAYKDSYALVALNGGATFTGCPSGTYTDVVTGQQYSGSTITVSAPKNQGQVRVLVKDWTGGKIGEDGPFIYASSAQHKGEQSYDGNQEAGTNEFYTADDFTPSASVSLTPNGASFKTETQSVKILLASDAQSGWYKIGDGEKVNLTPGQVVTVTVGQGMQFGESVTISWSATSKDGKERTGSAIYKKVDPNGCINIYVKCSKTPYLYAWSEESGTTRNLTGSWPGKALTEKEEVGDDVFYKYSITDAESCNIILNGGNGGQKTPDITGLSVGDYYYDYDGATVATVITNPGPVNHNPKLVFNPNGGTFRSETTTVTVSLKDAENGWYQVAGEDKVQLSKGESKTFTIGANMKEGQSKQVSWEATASDGKVANGTVTYKKEAPLVGLKVYVKCSTAPHLYAWTENNGNITKLLGEWPGQQMTEQENVEGANYWVYTFADANKVNCIFTLNGAHQTPDIKDITSDSYFEYDGNGKYKKVTVGPEPPTPTESFYAYFLAPAEWSNVMAWVWIDNGPNYTGGAWPGVNCTKTGEQRNGKDVWMWKYDGTETATPGKIIFNNGSGGTGNQTGDMVFVNGACYDMNGKTDIVITGINGVNAGNGTHKCVIYDMKGNRVAEVKSIADAEYILRSGVYVANGRKVVIK